MKLIRTIVFVMAMLTIITACKKEEDDKIENLSIETLSAKWNVNGTSDFESFEFNKSGNYIVVKVNQQIDFGSFNIQDQEKVVLANFGTITVSKIDNNNLNFDLSLNADPENTITVECSKATEFEATDRTELLCRTWKMISINGESVEGTTDEVSVLFSEAGTYLVTDPDGESGMAQWKWKDDTETILCYSWEGTPVCNGENEVDIVVLTAQELQIREYIDEESYLYVLTPLNSTKSFSNKLQDNDEYFSKKKGFIK